MGREKKNFLICPETAEKIKERKKGRKESMPEEGQSGIELH